MKGRGRSCSRASLCTGRCICEGDDFFLCWRTTHGEDEKIRRRQCRTAIFALTNHTRRSALKASILFDVRNSAAHTRRPPESKDIETSVRKRWSLRTDPGDENTNRNIHLAILSTLDMFESFCYESLGRIINPCSSISIPWAAHVPAHVVEEAVR